MQQMQTKAKVPNKQEIINNIKTHLPFLLEKKIWIAYKFTQSKNGTYSKPPVGKTQTQRDHTVKEGSPGYTFEEACEDGYPGIKTNERTSIVAFDIDDKEGAKTNRPFDVNRLQKDFKEFLIQTDSYAELSPSKAGLRILYHCADKTDLPGQKKLNSSKSFDGELFMNSGFVSITGDWQFGENIKEIEPYQLKQWYELDKKAEIIDIPVDYKDPGIPNLHEVKEILKYCSLDQSDRVKNAYETIMNQEYDHYDFWLKILAACHNYAEITNQSQKMIPLVVEWSQKDEIAYESDDDVVAHWSSFSSKENSITFKTLLKFKKLLKFQWPDEKYDSKGMPTGKPIPTSLLNFDYLMDYYELKFHTDIMNEKIYVTGNKDLLENYFKVNTTKTYFGMTGPYEATLLESVICLMAQQNGYQGTAISGLIPLFKNHFSRKNKQFNMMEKWLKTPHDQLPEDMVEKGTEVSKSNLDYLMSCIKFNDNQNIELATAFFQTFFYELVMPIYNINRIFAQRSFMLIMTGPEACRKTTFFSMLFPANLRRQFVTNSTETLGAGKSTRDFNTALVTSALVVCDEFENFYNVKNDSMFKTLVTQDVVDYVHIYEKAFRKENRNAALAGTTNKRSLAFEQGNNRRMAFIDVIWIDTNAMMKINWHHFYQYYIKEGEKGILNGQFPWKLNNETIQLQYQENERFRSKTKVETIICEVFDFDMKTHSTPVNYDLCGIRDKFPTMKHIIGILRQRYPENRFELAEMKHVLKRLCGSYTKTTNRKKMLVNSKAFIESGIIQQSDKTIYVMPPILTDFD